MTKCWAEAEFSFGAEDLRRGSMRLENQVIRAWSSYSFGGGKVTGGEDGRALCVTAVRRDRRRDRKCIGDEV